MGVKAIIGSFVAGFVMTLALLLVVPGVVDNLVYPFIVDLVGTATPIIGPDQMAQVIVWAVLLLFFIVLGAGGILRWFGVPGLAGLVVAYWCMGDVMDALLPLLTLCAVQVIMYDRKAVRRRKARQGGVSVREKRD